MKTRPLAKMNLHANVVCGLPHDHSSYANIHVHVYLRIALKVFEV